jgi:PII-like signaling protein
MQGLQLMFFTQQNRQHGHKPVSDWLLDLAKQSGLHGATIIGGLKGFGHNGQVHSANFFDLADQPQIIIMTATAEQAATVLSRIKGEKLQLFYVQTAAEFDLLAGVG